LASRGLSIGIAAAVLGAAFLFWLFLSRLEHPNPENDEGSGLSRPFSHSKAMGRVGQKGPLPASDPAKGPPGRKGPARTSASGLAGPTAGAIENPNTGKLPAHSDLGTRLRDRLRAGDLSAAKALLIGAANPSEPVADLEDAIARSRDLRERLMSLQLLASLQGAEAEAALVRVAEEPALPSRIRREAALALGSRYGAAAAATLRNLLTDSTAEIRLAAVQALGSPEWANALPWLSDALLNERDPAIRRAAAQAMGQINTPEAVEWLLGYLGSMGNGRPESDSARRIRKTIVWTLGGFSSPAAVPVLIDAFGRSSNPPLRRALLRSLARTADPRAFHVLLETVDKDPDPRARCEAIQGLGRIGNARALGVLRRCRESVGREERLAASTAIQRILEGHE
jgi:HEAT repeat protein